MARPTRQPIQLGLFGQQAGTSAGMSLAGLEAEVETRREDGPLAEVARDLNGLDADGAERRRRQEGDAGFGERRFDARQEKASSYADEE